ncbi:LPS export ABC transporter permease LptF [Carnimonas nigrificans]|uniref:LPS export ABC transporter permease LptF n=1 Tax=Carnimonas nigrificans TaxID=64323 RepID=UPI000470A3AA|nr:LPS export ABC transporter permease LptF [Carnimonas nigrificans]
MIIFRYLVREILITMLAVTAVLVLVVVGSQFIRFFSDAADGDFPITLVGNMMLYQLPSFMQLILPMAFFLGFLMAFGQLYLNSEMTVLQACGYSPKRLFKIALWPCLLTALIVGLCSLWLTPAGMSGNTRMLNEQASRLDFSVLTPGRFQEIGQGRTVYAASLGDRHSTLHNVFISEEHNGRRVISRAETGYQYTSPTNARYLQLANGYRYEVTPGSASADQMQFSTYSSLLKANPASIDDDDLSMVSTAELIAMDNHQGYGELQFRISIILMLPILALLGISLSKVNPRQGRFATLLPALILHVIYILSLITANNMIQAGRLSPWVGMWPIHLVYLLLGWWLFRRTFGRQGAR